MTSHTETLGIVVDMGSYGFMQDLYHQSYGVSVGKTDSGLGLGKVLLILWHLDPGVGNLITLRYRPTAIWRVP